MTPPISLHPTFQSMRHMCYGLLGSQVETLSMFAFHIHEMEPFISEVSRNLTMYTVRSCHFKELVLLSLGFPAICLNTALKKKKKQAILL